MPKHGNNQRQTGYHNKSQKKIIRKPQSGPKRGHVKEQAKKKQLVRQAQWDMRIYEREARYQQKLQEYFAVQQYGKLTTGLGQAFTAMNKANNLFRQGNYMRAALWYVLSVSIVTTYAPHMKDTMGMEHQDAPVMGNHKAMLEYHFPHSHPLHNKYKNDRELMRAIQKIHKTQKEDKKKPSSGSSSTGGGEESWITYSMRKTRKRRRRGGRRTRRGGAKTPPKGPSAKSHFQILAELQNNSSDDTSLGSDEQFPSLEELSSTPPETDHPPPRSPTHEEKMKDPDYAAAYNSRQRRIQKRMKDIEYGDAMGDGGNAYTPVGLYAEDDDDEPSIENNDAGVKQWNFNLYANRPSYHLPLNYTGDVPPQLKKQLDKGEISQSEYEEKRKLYMIANPRNVTTTYPMHYAMRSPDQRYGERNVFEDSEKYTGQPGKLGFPGLYDSFKGIPKDDISLPNLFMYPETREGSLLDTGYINKKKPNLERIGNEGVSRAYPNEKLGGRRRKKRGRGKKKKTRRIVCRKRKLTRKKRRRRR